MTAPVSSSANRLSQVRDDARPPRSTQKGDIPDAVLDRYLVERDRQGRAERFFRDHRVQAPSFRDHGRSLSTEGSYPDAVADMLRIARHRGWSSIRVTGDEAFRKEAWIQAREAGMEVKGYRPRERDRAAVGEPQPSPLPDRIRQRLDRAAVVVQRLVTDPEARRRLLNQAHDRALDGLGQDRKRRSMERDR